MSSRLSKVFHKIVKSTTNLKPSTADEAASIIKEHLVSEGSYMIARFGAVEIKAVLYPKIPVFLKSIFKKIMNYNVDTSEFVNMRINAGFFPANAQNITQFSELMHQDMKAVDVLGSWRFEERFLVSNFKKATIVKLDALEPYLHKNPWSEALEGKKVLVIHPFNKTIEQQYHNKRTLLFKDPRVLPAFASLQTIRAVQSIAGNKVKFKDWFEALDYMKSEIDKKDFDVAIIGAGAYGFPLAAHVKRMGKKAIHMGGPTQMLFGIKGKRWVDNTKFKDIINEHFIVPSDEDVIRDASKVEDGCYW
nr:conserved hypothetical protein [uncultured bacterium]